MLAREKPRWSGSGRYSGDQEKERKMFWPYMSNKHVCVHVYNVLLCQLIL